MEPLRNKGFGALFFSGFRCAASVLPTNAQNILIAREYSVVKTDGINLRVNLPFLPDLKQFTT